MALSVRRKKRRWNHIGLPSVLNLRRGHRNQNRPYMCEYEEVVNIIAFFCNLAIRLRCFYILKLREILIVKTVSYVAITYFRHS